MPESQRQLPLASSKLPQLRVDTQIIAEWTKRARDEIQHMLADRKSWYYKTPPERTAAKKTKCVFDKKGVRGYTLSPECARRKEFFGEGVLRLSLEDIAYGLYCDDTAQQRIVNAYMDDKYFLDAAVLGVFERRAVHDPFRFAGVKWAAYNSPPGVVTQYTAHDAMSDSDFVYFEYSCKTRDAEGNVVLVQHVSSLAPLSADQLQEHSAGLARGKHTQISTFRYMDDGAQYKTMGSFEVGEPIPTWVAMKFVLHALGSVTSLVGLADARAISSLGVATTAATTKTCSSCKKNFKLTRARLNCHACGQCVCKQCTLKLRFFNTKALFSSSVPLLAESKFCLQCVRRSREKRPERGSFCGSADAISSQESCATPPTSIDEHLLGDVVDDTDFWDLHDDVDGIDEYPVQPSSQPFDRNGAHLVAAAVSPTTTKKKKAVHEPVYTDKVVSIKGASRTISLASSPKRRPAASPVEVYLARARAEQQCVAEAGAAVTATAAARRQRATNAAHSPRSSPSPSATLEPEYGIPVDIGAAVFTATAAAAPKAAAAAPRIDGTDMFSKLTQSLAAQEQLLQSIQHEAHKMRVRAASGEASRRHRDHYRSASSIPESDRFEVISDA